MAWPAPDQERRKFQYPSLTSKPRSFRVIKLLPTRQSLLPPFKDILNIEIHELNVDDAAGEYDALSYCWGSGAADRTVVVSLLDNEKKTKEHQTLCISASLESALLSLARETNIEAARPIFADQICINQADDNEKIQQVRLMGELYTQSAKTIIWLGEETADTRLYFDFSSKINGEGILSRVMGPNRAHYINVFDSIRDSSIKLETEAEKEDRTDILDLVERYGSLFPIRGLSEVLRRAWVNRLWTVQEGTLPAHVIFRCGDQSLCYDCIRGTLTFHSIWATCWLRMIKGPVPKEEFRALDAIYTLNQPFLRLLKERKAIHGTQERRRYLYETVVQYNVNDEKPKIGATQAEDRIYALLGLAEKDDIYRETVEQMEVNNVRGTFTKFAASVITRNVDVLLFSQLPKSLSHGHQLPSWVPDWSNDPLRTPYGYSDLTTPVFCAGGRRDSVDVVVEVSTGVLRVNASLAGNVVCVGVRSIQHNLNATIENVDYGSVRSFFDEIDELLEVAVEINLTNAPDISSEQRRLESRIRLSDGGLSARQFPVQFNAATAGGLLRDIHKYAYQLEEITRQGDAQSRSTSVPVGMMSVNLLEMDTNLKRLGLESELLMSDEWLHYTSNLFKNIRRKLFVTDTGRVGLGPCHTQVGDAIVVIPGGSVPHILRPQDSPKIQNDQPTNRNVSSWSYVGEAYCDGIMDGEIFLEESNGTKEFNIV